MGKGKTRLCEWNKSRIAEDLKKLKKIVGNSKYVCLKCARAAGDADYLHKPEKLT